MKVIVIGGGASGLVASIFASLNNEVILLEKNSKLGKKILHPQQLRYLLL